jgi:hypothetical protein
MVSLEMEAQILLALDFQTTPGNRRVQKLPCIRFTSSFLFWHLQPLAMRKLCYALLVVMGPSLRTGSIIRILLSSDEGEAIFLETILMDFLASSLVVIILAPLQQQRPKIIPKMLAIKPTLPSLHGRPYWPKPGRHLH